VLCVCGKQFGAKSFPKTNSLESYNENIIDHLLSYSSSSKTTFFSADVINYSPSCRSKYIRLAFILITQMKDLFDEI